MSTIGEILADARRKKGNSIKDVEKATKIRSKYIEALENDEFEVIPGDVYVKGFLRSYSLYLNIDPNPLIKQYNLEHARPVTHHYEPEWSPPVSTAVRHRSTSAFLVAGVVGAVLVLAALLLWNANRSGEERPAVRTTRGVAGTEGGSVTTETPTKAVIPKPRPKKIRPVTIKARVVEERCWLRVMADGKRVYEGVLLLGETRTWHAIRQIKIRTGNSSAIELWKNGRYIGRMGESGMVTEETYTSEQ